MSRHNTLSLAVITGLSLLLTACGEDTSSDPRTQAPLVRTVTVSDSGLASRTFTGVVAARVESNLGFRVSGKVLKRLVDTGQVVKRGQVLMQLDPVDLTLAAQAEQESVIAAKARAKQAAQDEVRYRNLRGTGAISASTYDQFKAALDTANAQLRAAQAQAEVARNATRYADLVADADGTVIDTQAEPGQVVNAGQVVVRIAHAGAREAVIQLPETLRPALGSSGVATRFGHQDEPSVATLRQLSDAADPATRTFEARYVLGGDLQDAPLGATVTVNVTDERAASKAHFSIPVSALFDGGKGPGVWTVSGTPAKTAWRSVTIAQLDDTSAWVTGQIKQGDQIVALGAHLLHEGESVRVSAITNAPIVAEGRP